MNRLISLIILSSFMLSACFSNRAETNSQKSAYSIDNKGSDTIVNLALAWAEKYQSEHPDVSVSVTGGGSGTGIAAL
ncbi:MAG: phosphate-binding protein, partial [Bacteroidota bacterium]